MEIRALTGFNTQTRQQYGRQYTPLNGTLTALGSPSVGILPKEVDFGVNTQIKLPSYIPQQKIEMLDPQTGKKKWFTVDNINALTSLIQQGFKIFGDLKGGRGERVVVVKQSKSDIQPPKQAGMQVVSVLGGLVGAYLLFSLLMSKK